MTRAVAAGSFVDAAVPDRARFVIPIGPLTGYLAEFVGYFIPGRG